jgi:hypothetical protein
MSPEYETDEGAVSRRRRQDRRDRRKRKQRIVKTLYFVLGTSTMIGIIAAFFMSDISKLTGP